MSKKIKLGIVGAHRGGTFDLVWESLRDRVDIEAVCDIRESALDWWKEKHPDVARYDDYEKMLASNDCDAIFVSTPYPVHAPQAIAAMESGRHVLSEVVAADSIDDCWKLVETVRRTGKTYMFGENYCFMRHNMMVLNMVEQGLFGALTYAEGAYIHDCRSLFFEPDGTPTWRGLLRTRTHGNTYPTHSLGPVAKWLGINRTDRLMTAASFETPQVAVQQYARDRFGSDHPAAHADWYTHGDSTTTVLTTERGAVIVIRVDWASVRPHHMTHYVLQGSRGAYESARHGGEHPLVWIAGYSNATDDGLATVWENLDKYADQFDHPLWKKLGETAMKTAHGGGDYFVIREFLDALQEGRQPWIDVVDGVTWSSIVPLSKTSIERGGVPVPVPDFRAGRRGA